MRGVYLASVWLHILAAMTWIGGMVVFVVAVMPYFRGRPAIVFAAVMMVRAADTSGAPIAVADVQGGAWFTQSGCTACHSVSVYGIRNLAATGPDLSLAVEDVPRRFGRSLDDFLQAPSGTMAMVLSHRIRMSPEERLVTIGKLKEAHRQRSAP